MRLLERNNAGEIRLTEVPLGGNAPPYAILSHTWDAEEVSFKDLADGIGKNKLGYDKIWCAESRAGAIICDTFGSTHVASINRTTPSFRRLSTPCFAGTVVRPNVMSISPMSQPLPSTLTTNPSGKRL